MAIDALPEWVKPGVKFRYGTRWGKKVYHVRALMDDRAVIRYWSKTKKRWEYQILDGIWFALWERVIECGS